MVYDAALNTTYDSPSAAGTEASKSSTRSSAERRTALPCNASESADFMPASFCEELDEWREEFFFEQEQEHRTATAAAAVNCGLTQKCYMLISNHVP